ncbi:hypothetical protein MVES_003474 [Malassezia vespertilionis]|uniref:Maintenance of telomere capping protein 1 n=1 Tax=Malassezia vespertilionis TaxID=2020962 RepID=A0A2N1J7U4_9BASI|nr:hypothetical protein MVES_003474 [Malassezia vespertilionis]
MDSSVSRRKQEVDSLFADLSIEIDSSKESLAPARQQPHTAFKAADTSGDDAQRLLDDLEGLVQRKRSQNDVVQPRSDSQVPYTTPHSSTHSASPVPGMPARDAPVKEPTQEQERQDTSEPSASGWAAWGESIFSHASKYTEQARVEIGRRAATLTEGHETNAEGAAGGLQLQFPKGLRNIVHDAGLDQFGRNLSEMGKRGWDELLSVVAPPLESSERLEVTLSHDMEQYKNLEGVVFKALLGGMENAGVTELSVRTYTSDRAEKDRTESSVPLGTDQVASSKEEAVRRSKEAIVPIIQRIQEQRASAEDDSALSIVLHIQPFFQRALEIKEVGLLDTIITPKQALSSRAKEKQQDVTFIVWWLDPAFGLSHYTVSQMLPSWWPPERNAWVAQRIDDDYIQSRAASFASAFTATETA